VITAFNLVYSIAAVRRMVSDRFQVVRIEKWWRVVLVVFKGCRPRFMSQQAFKNHFVQWRKLQAQALSVRQFQALRYVVGNEAKRSAYLVECRSDAIECECDDYKNQIEFLGKGCCKHGYAVLSVLGFDSLQAYVKAHGSGGYLRSQVN
jgi:hypothetical protein